MLKHAPILEVPDQGSALLELPSGDSGPSLEIRAPAMARYVDLRGFGAAPVTAADLRIEGCDEYDILPLPGGVWIRLRLPEAAERNILTLTLPQTPRIDRLLARLGQPAMTPPSFACIGTPPFQPPAAVPADLKAGLRALPLPDKTDLEMRLAVLNRLPRQTRRDLIDELIAGLADCPSGDSSPLLPFLSLLSRT